MKIEREINIEFTPKEVVNEMWDMASFEQAELMLHIADLWCADPYHFSMQLEFIRNEFENDYSADEILKIKNLIGKLVDFFADDDFGKGGDTE